MGEVNNIIRFDELRYGERFRAVRKSLEIWIRLFPSHPRRHYCHKYVVRGRDSCPHCGGEYRTT